MALLLQHGAIFENYAASSVPGIAGNWGATYFAYGSSNTPGDADVTLSDTKILEIYALRWSIEVYFKEIKQHLGFLKEQSGRYQLAYASVHLAAMRYLLLFEAMLREGQLSYGEIRDRESGRLQTLTYAALLWQLFRALIEGALEGLVRDLGRKVVKKVLAAIDQTVEGFLSEALQISPQQISVQLKAEELGYL